MSFVYEFDKVKTCDDLLCAVRRRHQMWVRSAYELYGFISGFACAFPSLDFERMRDFQRFVDNFFGEEKYLPQHFQDRAERRPSEVPLFFELYESFSGISPVALSEHAVSEQGKDAFLKRWEGKGVSEYYPPPCYFQIAEYSNWGVFLFYLDEGRKRYYEQGMESADYAGDFIRKAFYV